MHLIDKIYHRSSINQLIFSTAMFALIWLNFTDAVYTFHLNKDYLVAINVFLFIGLTRIVEAARAIAEGDARRAVAHATSGQPLQQNLVCVLEGDQ